MGGNVNAEHFNECRGPFSVGYLSRHTSFGV